MGQFSAHCAKLASPDYTNFGFSLFILIGILVSYLPQHYRIISRRSSFGLSPYFVLLGMTSGTCAFANILTLPASRKDIACCDEIDAFPCFAGLLGVLQVGVQWGCFTIILLLFLIFFPRASPPTTEALKDHKAPTFRTALVVTGLSILHALIIIIFSLYFIFARPQSLQRWANFLGIFAAVLASIQYFPQIYTTYMLKRVGSLSIPMMLIQTPGSFVWSASLAARVGKAGWSTWGVYLVTGCLQGTLLVMGTIYELQERKRKKIGEIPIEDDVADGPGPAEVTSEQTPLLQPNR